MFTDFNPVAGREQALKRPAPVLSPEIFNRKIGLAPVAPIASRVRGHGFEVELIDFSARGIRYVEQSPGAIVRDALSRVRTIVA